MANYVKELLHRRKSGTVSTFSYGLTLGKKVSMAEYLQKLHVVSFPDGGPEL